MAEPRRTFTREAPQQRREDLVRATLNLIAAHGPSAATVRAISAEADVTQGLIRHYFSNKEELIAAAYEHHMTSQLEMTVERSADRNASALEGLRQFVIASVTPPVADPGATALWAGFIHMVQRHPAMRAIHERTYFEFRERLESHIEAALKEAGRLTPKSELRRLAIACNAVLDGLWLEGGALPEAFSEGEVPEIAISSVAKILDLNLVAGDERS